MIPYRCTVDDVQFAGLSCSEEEPCPIYLELTTVEAAGQRILVGGNIHSTSITLYSVLLSSDDGGHTWREAHERLRGSGLDRFHFFDAENGWATGQVLFPLEQDPFVLVTTDGGRTWRQKAVFDESREDRYGSIQQFSFTSKDNGSLVIDRGTKADGDRYELFESHDGGDSWTIKQTSTKPLQLRGMAALPSEWRLRADAPTQSYHVEHRQGQRWANAAAFAVKLPVCKGE